MESKVSGIRDGSLRKAQFCTWRLLLRKNALNDRNDSFPRPESSQTLAAAEYISRLRLIEETSSDCN